MTWHTNMTGGPSDRPTYAQLESALASEHAKRVEAEAKATEDQRWQAGYDEGYRDAIKENAEPASTEKETFNYVANDPGMGEDD